MNSNAGKQCFLVLILFSCISFVTAQDTEEQYHWYVGLEGGYAYNMLYSSSGYRAFTEYQEGHGFTAGIPVQYALSDWFAVQSGVQYIQKNYVLARTGVNDTIRSEWTNSFLEFPLIAQFSFGGSRLRGFFNAGGSLGVWLDSHIRGTNLGISESPYNLWYIDYVGYDETVPWDDKRDNRFEAVLLAGAGLRYRLDPCTFFIEGRFNYGLTDLQKDYMKNQVPRINDTITVQAGVLFNAGIFSLFRGGKK